VKVDADDEEEMKSEEIVLILIVNSRSGQLKDMLHNNMDSLVSHANYRLAAPRSLVACSSSARAQVQLQLT